MFIDIRRIDCILGVASLIFDGFNLDRIAIHREAVKIRLKDN